MEQGSYGSRRVKTPALIFLLTAEAEKFKEYSEKVRQIRHDIRSPLSSLLSVQEALGNDELLQQTIGSSIKGIQRMLDDLSQLDKKEEVRQLTIVEVLAEEAVAAAYPKFFKAKQVDLSIEYNSTQLSPVTVVQDGLRRVLDNLLENAFEAVSSHGTIKLAIAVSGSKCQIAVEDNGCGIAPENVAKLFQKGATFGKVNGSGLGLYHAKRSVEAWDGTIEYIPISRGTRFVITLPLVQSGVVFAGIPVEKKLLVIDDDAMIAETLELSGFEIVHSAKTASEGRSLLKTREPEVAALVDQHLGPNDFGTDLIADLPTRQGVYLCTSAFDDPDVIQRARHLGVPIIPKPLCFLVEPRASKAD